MLDNTLLQLLYGEVPMNDGRHTTLAGFLYGVDAGDDSVASTPIHQHQRIVTIIDPFFVSGANPPFNLGRAELHFNSALQATIDRFDTEVKAVIDVGLKTQSNRGGTQTPTSGVANIQITDGLGDIIVQQNVSLTSIEVTTTQFRIDVPFEIPFMAVEVRYVSGDIIEGGGLPAVGENNIIADLYAQIEVIGDILEVASATIAVGTHARATAFPWVIDELFLGELSLESLNSVDGIQLKVPRKEVIKNQVAWLAVIEDANGDELARTVVPFGFEDNTISIGSDNLIISEGSFGFWLDNDNDTDDLPSLRLTNWAKAITLTEARTVRVYAVAN